VNTLCDSPQYAGDRPMQKILNVDTAIFKEQQFEIDDNISIFESIVLLLSILVLTSFFIIAVWSGILLLYGKTEGGGPLGMLMNLLHTQFPL
jgi:hypothetical protein